MKLTKTLCGVTAALTVLSSMAVTAQAEETQLKLLTANFNDVVAKNGIKYSLGGGYYSDDDKIFGIGEKELAEWRETGKIAYRTIESDLDISDLTYWSGDFENGYVQFCKRDSEGKVTDRYVTLLDKNIGKISTQYTFGSTWRYTRSDGYTFGAGSMNSTSVVAVVTDPSGKEATAFFKSDGEAVYAYGATTKSDNSVGYILWKSGETVIDDMTLSNFELYVIDKNGDAKKVYSNENCLFNAGISGDNNVCWWDQSFLKSAVNHIYNADNGKIYTLSEPTIKCENASVYTYGENLSVGHIYGDTTVICGVNSLARDEALCVLVDLENPNVPRSKAYKNIYTTDGKIYFIQTIEGKWGYIDANGKELALFDDAGAFYGNYAPVISNGKAYLIDRNMNKVSDEIAADSVSTMDDELFRFTKGDDITLVTYTEAEKQSTTSETTSSETVSEPAASELTSSEAVTSSTVESSTSSTDNTPVNNPATGVTMAMIPVAVIGGAAVITAKKRRK